jgi:hypothetical protein
LKAIFAIPPGLVWRNVTAGEWWGAEMQLRKNS